VLATPFLGQALAGIVTTQLAGTQRDTTATDRWSDGVGERVKAGKSRGANVSNDTATFSSSKSSNENRYGEPQREKPEARMTNKPQVQCSIEGDGELCPAGGG